MKQLLIKKSIYLLALVFIIINFTGCATTSTVENEYEYFKNNRPTAIYIQTGDSALDQLGKSVAGIYKQTTEFLDEYYDVTEGHRDYNMFTTRIIQLELQGKDQKEAHQIALQEAVDAEAKNGGPKPGEPDVKTKIENSQKAIATLEPVKKLKKLLALSVEITKFVLQTPQLAKSFSSLDANILNKLSASAKVIEQANYTKDALSFLIRRYQKVEALKNDNVLEDKE